MRNADPRTKAQLLEEITELRSRLEEAEQTLQAIRSGEVDALVVEGPQGDRVFSLTGAEHIYRVIAETMHEAALTVGLDGTVLFCNRRFSELMKTPMNQAVGRKVGDFVSRPQEKPLEKLLADVQAGPVQRRLTLRASDGTSVPVQLSASLVEDPSTSICLIASDLTEIEASSKSIRTLREHQQALEESEAKLRQQISILAGVNRIITEAVKGGTDEAWGNTCLAVAEEVTGSMFGFVGMLGAEGQLDNIAISDPGWDACRMGDSTGHRIPPKGFDVHGIYGRALKDGKGLFTNDPSSHPDRIGLPAGHPPLKAFLGVPLIHAGWTIGIVAVGNREGGYSETELEALESLAPAIVDGYLKKRSREALTASEARLRGVLDATQESIWMFSPDGVILLANHTGLARMGKTAQEIIGKGFQEVFLPDLAKARQERLREVVESGRPVEFEDERAGLRFNHTFYPILDGTGRVTSVVSFSRDITERKQMETALRESERLYRAIGESIDYGIWVCARDGRNIYASESFLKMVGMTQEQCSNFGWGDVLHPDDAERTLAAWKECVETGGTWDIEHRFRGVDGQWHPVLARGVPVKDDRDETICWAGINLDISRIKRAEEAMTAAQRQGQSIIDNTTAIIYAFDLEERFLLANTTLAELLNSTPERMIGKRRHEFMPKDDADWHEANDRHVVEAGSALEFEEYSQLKDRSITWLTTKFPLRDAQGRIYAVAGISADVSERKRMEEALQKAHAELKAHARKLEEANRELEGFSYTISHDLRAPLRAINGFARMLADDYGHSLEEEARRRLDVIESNAVRMGLLIEDLLAFSRAGRNAMNITRIDMNKLAADVVEFLKTSNEGFEGDIQVSPLPPAQGDPAIIRQVIVNLLENAVKFSAKRPDPRIEVGSFVREGEQVYFVKDNGVGFDMQYHDKLFGVFQRLVTEKEFKGTGVGLAIVRRLVSRHGGRVWAEGKVNEGASFYFTLPGKDGHS